MTTPIRGSACTGSAAAREVRDKIFAERFDAVSKRYLADLRRKAIIEVK